MTKLTIVEFKDDLSFLSPYIPIRSWDSQSSEFFPGFFCKSFHIWNCLRACYTLSLILSDHVLAFCYRAEHHLLYNHLQSSGSWHSGFCHVGRCKIDAPSLDQNLVVDVFEHKFWACLVQLTECSKFSWFQKRKQYYDSH